MKLFPLTQQEDIGNVVAENVENVVETGVQETEKLAGILNSIGEKIVSMAPSVLFAVIVLILGIIISKALVKIILKFFKKSNMDRTVYGFVKSLLTILLYTLVIVIVLTMIGVPTTSIITLLGAAGLAVSLALQSSLSNLAGGFIILLAKPFKVGDFIEAGDVAGTVDNISILYTRLVTGDNKSVHIPNGMVSGGKIINYTERNTRRLDLEFSISYNNDFEKAKSIIMDVIDRNELALKDPAPMVRVGSHGESSVVIYARVWVNADKYWDLNFDMIENVKAEFDKNDIEIPYNKLDVHIEK